MIPTPYNVVLFLKARGALCFKNTINWTEPYFIECRAGSRVTNTSVPVEAGRSLQVQDNNIIRL